MRCRSVKREFPHLVGFLETVKPDTATDTTSFRIAYGCHYVECDNVGMVFFKNPAVMVVGVFDTVGTNIRKGYRAIGVVRARRERDTTVRDCERRILA